MFKYLWYKIFPKKETELFNKETTNHEVFAIKPSENGKTYAFIGYRISSGNFHFESIPYTEK